MKPKRATKINEAKIKFVTKDNGKTQMKFLINHPMESGLRKDPKTGLRTPAHYIEKITLDFGQDVVLQLRLGMSYVRNPYVSMMIDQIHDGQAITIELTDNQGNSVVHNHTVILNKIGYLELQGV
jgi:sulfur-oxidizing protein SoxZ